MLLRGRYYVFPRGRCFLGICFVLRWLRFVLRGALSLLLGRYCVFIDVGKGSCIDEEAEEKRGEDLGLHDDDG